MKYKIIILITSILTIISCGKTDEDKDYETRITGTWYSMDFNYLYSNDTTFFFFYDNNEGKTAVRDYEDNMAWEIKRSTLKTYYKEAPSYNIGYDQYNSQGVYKIQSFDDNKIELIQYFYSGAQINGTIYRYK